MTENRQPPAYHVGQRVWVYNVNSRPGEGPLPATVTKVGRTLVTVGFDEPYRPDSQYRMEDGSWNNRDYSHHSWIRTDEQRAVEERRAAADRALRDLGVQVVGWSDIPTAKLEAVVEVLRS